MHINVIVYHAGIASRNGSSDDTDVLVGVALAARLRSRRGEIERAALNRVQAIAGPVVDDPQYAEGLRAALSAALDFALTAIERGEVRAPPVPAALLAQARIAARNGIGLDTVLRRYFAGYSLLGDALIEEADGSGVEAPDLQRLVRGQSAVFDRVLAAIGEEYAREVQEGTDSIERRRAERVERLLDGEMLDTTDLAYDFGGHHAAVAASGSAAADLVRELAAVLDVRLLLVRRDETTVWGWLGGRRRLSSAEVEQAVPQEPNRSQNFTLAVGEPGRGIAGWRLSHRQAAAALPIARRSEDRVVRYADVALLASIVQDDLVTVSLRELYLEPLRRERDGGKAARATLQAYFAANHNVSSAAVALGVNRNTVASRLASIESRLGCRLAARAFELEAALRLEDLDNHVLDDSAGC